MMRFAGMDITYLYVGPHLGNLVWNYSGFVSLTKWRNFFHCFPLRFTYILLPHNMIILYFRLRCFHVSNSIFAWYFGTLIIHRRALDTFRMKFHGNSINGLNKKSIFYDTLLTNSIWYLISNVIQNRFQENNFRAKVCPSENSFFSKFQKEVNCSKTNSRKK